MQKILSQKIFDRDPVTVCQELLGNFLVIKKRGKIFRYMITEVEAYDGQEDEACHARHGKTERNVPMFGHPGYRYVYMIYGMYYMLNIVTGPGCHPSAILIRGISEMDSGRNAGRRNEVQSKKQKNLAGPGKLTKNLGINKKFNGKKADEKTGLRVEESGIKISNIQTGPRIGIDYASDEWKLKHWRFFI